MGEVGSRCLDEQEVLALVDGTLQSERRRALLAHVDDCATCRRLVAAIAHAGSASNEEEAPQRASTNPGTVLGGRFRVIAAIGRGALGTVHRVHDEKLGIDVAMKLFRRGAAPDPKALAREVTVGRRITHPNVCRIYDGGTTDGLDYITMELIEGETLASLLAREKLSFERTLEVLDGIADGLAAAHAQGIVHRDLKPANVMIEKGTGRPVITDFGFAIQPDVKQSRKLVGTPSYWAPEQARGEPATPASDVYSFGVLAYRLLAGRDFRLSDRDASQGVPRRFRRVVGKCVAPWPRERYETANDVRKAFRRAERSRRHLPWKIAALGAAALLAVWGASRVAPDTRASATQPSNVATISPPAESSAASSPSTAPTPTRPPPPPETATAAVVSAATASVHSHPQGVQSARVHPAPSASSDPAPVSPENDILYIK